ncbi:LCP family glycopolymer transferase [Enterococcus sp. LJL90]
MRVWQKIVLGFVFAVLLVVIGVVAYGTKAYYDLKATASQTYESVERISETKRSEEVDYSSLEPISILLMGVDTDVERTEEGDTGRTDSMMVVTINPGTGQTTMVSIPRDTLVEMDYQYGNVYIQYDKINAAYAYGGAALAMKTVEDLLDIPIDHYATVNMDGMADLIDAVGGVTVNNAFAFDLNMEHFDEGELQLTGKRAVEYARMRYEDPNGDYGRQERQREVLEQLFNQITSVGTLSNYQNLLDVLGENGKTDLDWSTISSLVQNYTPALSNFVTDQLQGVDYTGDGYIGESGISFQQVTEEEIIRVQNLLKEQLNEATITELASDYPDLEVLADSYTTSTYGTTSSDTYTYGNDTTYDDSTSYGY